MSLNDKDIAAACTMLQTAERTHTPCGRLTDAFAGFDIDDAYRVQQQNIAARLTRGRTGKPTRVVGHKVGITSTAVMEWLGVDQPDFGHLLDEMWVPDEGTAPIEHLLQPRIEGEIAFVLGAPLRGPGLTVVDVMRAVESVLPALEIVDSRIADWKIKIEDTIADNASSGLFVVGNTPRSVAGVDLVRAGMTLRKNGEVVSTGAGVNCLGNPLNAVVWLANTLGERGKSLEAGHVILSGAMGPVTPVVAGDVVSLDIAHVGHCRVTFKDTRAKTANAA